MVKTIKKHPGGRPLTFKDTIEGREKFIRYTKDYAHKLARSGDTFTMESWATFLGITRQSLYNYMKKGKEWKEVMASCLGIIASVMVENSKEKQRRGVEATL